VCITSLQCALNSTATWKLCDCAAVRCVGPLSLCHCAQILEGEDGEGPESDAEIGGTVRGRRRERMAAARAASEEQGTVLYCPQYSSTWVVKTRIPALVLDTPFGYPVHYRQYTAVQPYCTCTVLHCTVLHCTVLYWFPRTSPGEL